MCQLGCTWSWRWNTRHSTLPLAHDGALRIIAITKGWERTTARPFPQNTVWIVKSSSSGNRVLCRTDTVDMMPVCSDHARSKKAQKEVESLGISWRVKGPPLWSVYHCVQCDMWHNSEWNAASCCLGACILRPSCEWQSREDLLTPQFTHVRDSLFVNFLVTSKINRWYK